MAFSTTPISSFHQTTRLTLCLTSQFNPLMVAVILGLFLLTLNPVNAETIPPSQATLFEHPLQNATQKSINKHFAGIGGFQQSKTSFGKKNYDKYYSHSQLGDSYYLDFRFNSAGQLTKATQLFRPYNDSLVQSVNHDSRAITTQDVARKFIQTYGQPTQMERKGWGGFSTYNAYTWEDDNLKILVDRQGGESLGNVYVQYQIKNIPIHFVEVDDKKLNKR